MNELDITSIVNLLVAFFLGILIGLPREREGKVAGLRTHVLVAVGSALFMVISEQMMLKSGAADPGRIASGIVTGIGFLGAGCIMQGGSSVRGMTTAASIWITAAIGVAAGAGMYVPAVSGTIITLITLQVLRWTEKKFFKTKDEG